jgi:hypothetical protein
MGAKSCGHGRYIAGCEVCRAADRIYRDRARARKLATGWRPAVPVTDVRPHILKLRAAHMNNALIAKLSGVSEATIGAIACPNPPRPTVFGATAAALLAVEPVPVTGPRRDRVRAIGTVRRLRALHSQGHPFGALAPKISASPRTLQHIARGAIWTIPDVADRVAALYDEWAGLPGELTAGRKEQAVRARNTAQRHGWDGPDAWDDDTIDDPAAKPRRRPAEQTPHWSTVRPDYISHALVGTAHRDDLTRAELVEVVTLLARRGMSDTDIDRHLRWTPTDGGRPGDAVLHYRQRHNIPTGGLHARTARNAHRRQIARSAAA